MKIQMRLRDEIIYNDIRTSLTEILTRGKEYVAGKAYAQLFLSKRNAVLECYPAGFSRLPISTINISLPVF